jgi:aspartyl-tRNA(Asn)/glutamyl-tRNA(Gln) amidotransferase subunit B
VDLVRLIQAQAISHPGAKQALSLAWKTGEQIPVIVDREGLRQVSDVSALEPLVRSLIAESPTQVAEFKSGKEKVMGFFVGQIMKKSGGKANPAMLQDLIRKVLSES